MPAPNPEPGTANTNRMHVAIKRRFHNLIVSFQINIVVVYYFFRVGKNVKKRTIAETCSQETDDSRRNVIEGRYNTTFGIGID